MFILIFILLGMPASRGKHVSNPKPSTSSKISMNKPKTKNGPASMTDEGEFTKKLKKESGADSSKYASFVEWMRKQGFCWDDEELDLRSTGTN